MKKLSRNELTNLAIGLPIATAIIGVLAGIGMGVGLGWAVKPGAGPSDDQVARLTLDAFSAGQIDFKCGQIRSEELENANERIAALETEREEYSTKVLKLEAELETQRSATMVNTGARGTGSAAGTSAAERARLDAAVRELSAQLEGARNQLASVTQQLSAANEEKLALQQALVATSTQLAVTEEKLEVQVVRTRDAQLDALNQKWWRFLADAQLDICEKGSRKKLGRCREIVGEKLTAAPIRNRFLQCVRSGQATPAAFPLEKGEAMPRFSKYIDQESKIVKDWAVRMCDPTLPEATGVAMPSQPPVMPLSTTVGGRSLEVDLGGLEDLDAP